MSTLHTKVIISKNIKMDRDYKHVLDYSEANILALCQNASNLVAKTETAQFINPTRKGFSSIYLYTMLTSKLYGFSKPRL